MTAVLITGGTGSFGHALTQRLLTDPTVTRLVILSRDEVKQAQMAVEFPDPRMRFFVGDVRDAKRVKMAMQGIDTVYHAAALKRIEQCEYNPFEAVQTNILGTQNVLDAAVDCGVGAVVVLSTDKACNPVNLYGATKLCVEKLTTAANAYTGASGTRFMALRYGNVAGSRGSVIPLWRKAAKEFRPLTITDPRMTRFWMTLPKAVDLALLAAREGRGGEVFIPKIPSVQMEQLLAEVVVAAGLKDGWEMRLTGLRPGEKLHEAMVGPDESHLVRDYGTHYCLHPTTPWKPQREDGTKMPEGWSYTSDTNPDFLSGDALTFALQEVPE